MCIIAYKPIGEKLPHQDTLATCMRNNPHGTGYMFPENGTVTIRKGFNNVGKLLTDIHAHVHDIKHTPVVIHARIATSGKKNTGQMHPFPVVSDTEQLTAKNTTAQYGLAHNGIMDMGADGMSDTMLLVKHTLAPLVELVHARDIITNVLWYIDMSRFALMDGTGDVELTGDTWEKYAGTHYSNTGYKRYVYKTKTTPDTPGSAWYERNDRLLADTPHDDEGMSYGDVVCEYCGSTNVYEYQDGGDTILYCVDCVSETVAPIPSQIEICPLCGWNSITTTTRDTYICNACFTEMDMYGNYIN